MHERPFKPKDLFCANQQLFNSFSHDPQYLHRTPNFILLTFSFLSHTPVVRGKLCTFSDWWKTSKGVQVNLYFTRILETCLGQRANVPYMCPAVQDREAN